MTTEYFSRKEASNFLRSIGCPISAAVLAQLACHNNAGGGPPYTRIRWRKTVYKRQDLIDWAAKQTEHIK